jgi:hypothetical protein
MLIMLLSRVGEIVVLLGDPDHILILQATNKVDAVVGCRRREVGKAASW